MKLYDEQKDNKYIGVCKYTGQKFWKVQIMSDENKEKYQNIHKHNKMKR